MRKRGKTWRNGAVLRKTDEGRQMRAKTRKSEVGGAE